MNHNNRPTSETAYKNINLTKGGLLGALAALFLSAMAVFVKLVSAKASNNTIIFSRFLISFIYIVAILLIQKARGHSLHLKPRSFYLHILRAIFGVLAMSLFYYSLRFISVMDGNLLMMTTPLFIPLITLVCLQMRTSKIVLLAIIIGFVGTMFVLKPSKGIIDPHALFALGGGLSGAFALFFLRELGKRDHPQAMLFYYFLITVVLSGLSTLIHWHLIWNLHNLLLLLGVGISGTLYQECLMRSSCYAPASVTSTLLYLSVLFSTGFDWLIWGTFPDILNIAGLILIVLASYFIVSHQG